MLIDRQHAILDIAREVGRVLVDDLAALTGAGRRVGMLGFHEFRSGEFASVPGIEFFDLEYDVHAFDAVLPRVRVIPIEEFDPAQFLG